jgi:hypothetical protein
VSHTASDARTDGLAAIARDLVVRVRDDDPAAARDPLLGLDPADVIEVALILARMVPDQATPNPRHTERS